MAQSAVRRAHQIALLEWKKKPVGSRVGVLVSKIQRINPSRPICSHARGRRLESHQ